MTASIPEKSRANFTAVFRFSDPVQPIRLPDGEYEVIYTAKKNWKTEDPELIARSNRFTLRSGTT